MAQTTSGNGLQWLNTFRLGDRSVRSGSPGPAANLMNDTVQRQNKQSVTNPDECLQER